MIALLFVFIIVIIIIIFVQCSLNKYILHGQLHWTARFARTKSVWWQPMGAATSWWWCSDLLGYRRSPTSTLQPCLSTSLSPSLLALLAGTLTSAQRHDKDVYILWCSKCLDFDLNKPGRQEDLSHEVLCLPASVISPVSRHFSY